MAFSRQLITCLALYILRQKVCGHQRYPLVLMLEPLFRCNLRCAGCGRIREYQDILDQLLSVEECLTAADEAGAPVVSITGGEPLLHPEIDSIVSGLIAQKRFVNLCTNGLLLEKSLARFKPSPQLSFVVHLDGLAPSHDALAGREGVFATALSAIHAAQKAGFQVLINSTVYKQTDIEETKRLFLLLSRIPVDGIMVAPAFSYAVVGGDSFLSREEVHQAFMPLYRMRHQVPFYNTLLYWQFLTGKIKLNCTPWSTPTRNPKGWKRPCYLLTDGHCRSFGELMNETKWDNYGNGNSACSNCMVHCGFEASALGAMKALPNLWRMVTAR